jgi:hypothetical protein
MPSDPLAWSWEAIGAIATALATFVALGVAVWTALASRRDRLDRALEADRQWKVAVLGELLASYDGAKTAYVTGVQLRLLAMLGDVELPRWRDWAEAVGLEHRKDFWSQESVHWWETKHGTFGPRGERPDIIRLLREELVVAIAKLNGVQEETALRVLRAYHEAPEMQKGSYGPWSPDLSTPNPKDAMPLKQAEKPRDD